VLKDRAQSPGRALTPEEERALLNAGASRPGWASACYMTILSMNTAAGPAELLGLRLRDVFADHLESARIYICENVPNKHVGVPKSNGNDSSVSDCELQQYLVAQCDSCLQRATLCSAMERQQQHMDDAYSRLRHEAKRLIRWQGCWSCWAVHDSDRGLGADGWTENSHWNWYSRWGHFNWTQVS
jgi:hypothetical protein